MKKIIASAFIVLAAVTMIGCSNKSSKALSSFESQLDYVEEIVGSTNSSEVADVSPARIYNSLSNQSLQEHKTIAYSNMSREEEIRQQVLSLNSYLKSLSCDKLKLNKNQIEALKTMTYNVKKYTTQLKDSKSDVKSYVNKIRKNFKESKSTEITESSYIALNNSMNERYTCLCNIYNNLENVYYLVYKDCEETIKKPNFKNENQNNVTKNTENNTQKDNKIDKEEKSFKKNIDSYQTANNTIPNNKQNQPYNQPAIENNYANPYYGYPYNNPYTNPYRMYNGYQIPGYGNNYVYNGMNGYGNFYNNKGFNPSRNTDTYYSLNRNIDTYRFSPDAYRNFPAIAPTNELPVNSNNNAFTNDNIQTTAKDNEEKEKTKDTENQQVLPEEQNENILTNIIANLKEQSNQDKNNTTKNNINKNYCIKTA